MSRDICDLIAVHSNSWSPPVNSGGCVSHIREADAFRRGQVCTVKKRHCSNNTASTHQTSKVSGKIQVARADSPTHRARLRETSEWDWGQRQAGDLLLDKLSQLTTSLRGLNDSTTPPLRHQQKTCRASQEQSRQTKDTQIHIHPPHFNKRN